MHRAGTELTTLSDIVGEHAAHRGDEPSVCSVEGSLTYQQLDARSNRLARALDASGLAPGRRVVFVGKNCVEYFETLFGAAKAGVVPVAANWRLAPAELAYVVNDAEAGLVVVGEDFHDLVGDLPGRLEQSCEIVAIGGAPGAHEYEDWIGARSEATLDPFPAGPDDVALQLYTSGTTGRPKGALITNRAIVARIPGVAEAYEITSESVTQVAMPLFHVGGTGWSLLTLYGGSSIVVTREAHPARMLDDVERFGVTHTFAVPTVLQAVLDEHAARARDIGSLEVVVYGAAPISPELLTRAISELGCRLAQTYGLTETSGGITILTPEDHDVRRPELLRSCGRPFPWIEVSVVDAEKGVPVPAGETGELWTRSFQNMAGYWQRPEASAEVLTDDGWLRTGDLGHRDEEGYVYLHDRLHDMIVSGGENVYPAEVEHALLAHPDVLDVAVVGAPHPRWGETVRAVVVPRPGAQLDAPDLIAFTRERLAHFKCPTMVDFVAELPRNASGKLLRRALRDG